MFDGLLGRGGFSSNKSLIKSTRTRIDVVRRKRNATQKFLKKDIADLLADGLEINAIGRAEGLIVELCLTSCYDFIDHICEILLKHLSAMQKSSDCPEDCREAVASLMFSAARVSDLPELRDLREAFKDRYGNSLDCYVNQQLVQHIAPDPPDMDKKLKLLEDIASEFSITWDRSSFEQSMKAAAREKTPAYIHPAENKYMPPHVPKTVPSKGNNDTVAKKKIEVPELMKGRDVGSEREHGYNRHNCTQATPSTVQKSKDADVLPKRRELLADGHSSLTRENGNRGRMDHASPSSIGRAADLKVVPEKHHHVAAYQVKAEKSLSKDERHVESIGHVKHSQDSIASPMRKLPEEEPDRLKSNIRSNLPPPYVKPKTSKHRSRHSESHINGNDDTLTFGGQNVAPVKEDIPHFTVEYYKSDSSGYDPTPRRRPRRRHHKQSSTPSDNDDAEEVRVVRRTSTTRRRNDTKKGLQILCDDDNEGVIDKLLLHYSKKPAGVGEPSEKPRRTKTGCANSDGQAQQPSRSISLPHEQSSSEMKKAVFTRAVSLDEDASTPAKHVHPKLPDCDDLAARFAALRRK
ncbi:hypothetical protein V2J09_018810 [Rumex salicifolius]